MSLADTTTPSRRTIEVALAAEDAEAGRKTPDDIAGVVAQQRHGAAVAGGHLGLENVGRSAPRHELDERVGIDHARVVLEGIADENVARLRGAIEVDLRRRKHLGDAAAVLQAGLAVGEDDDLQAGQADPALGGGARQQREIDRLALDDLGLHRLQLEHDAVPFALGKHERIARQVEIDRALEIAVRKRLVLVRAEVARARDRREHGLAHRRARHTAPAADAPGRRGASAPPTSRPP